MRIYHTLHITVVKMKYRIVKRGRVNDFVILCLVVWSIPFVIVGLEDTGWNPSRQGRRAFCLVVPFLVCIAVFVNAVSIVGVFGHVVFAGDDRVQFCFNRLQQSRTPGSDSEYLAACGNGPIDGTVKVVSQLIKWERHGWFLCCCCCCCFDGGLAPCQSVGNSPCMPIVVFAHSEGILIDGKVTLSEDEQCRG